MKKTMTTGGRKAITAEQKAAARYARMVAKLGPELARYYAGSVSESVIQAYESGNFVTIVAT